MKKVLTLLLILVVVILGIYLWLHFQMGPYGRGGTVYIPKGASVAKIAEELKAAKLIRSPLVFKILARWEKADKNLQAGEYEFPAGVTPRQVIAKLRRGERVIHQLTIPEGYSFSQIAALIEKTGIASGDQVRATFRDPAYLGLLGFPAISLEGYLFPDTYEYDRGTSLKDLLIAMIRNFQKNFDAAMTQRALGAGWSVPQVVTLASIIEKETGQPAERPMVSSVFHNRLKIGMPLQADPTVIYGIPNFDGNIRKGDLSNPHAYNTYVHVGLPPTPIASPGKKSLEAALYPATTNYLFFVGKRDGTHYFSATVEEHNQAVAQYQLGVKPAATPVPNPSPALLLP